MAGDRVMFNGCMLEFTVPAGADLGDGQALMARMEAELPGLLEPVRARLASHPPQAEVRALW